MRTLLLTLITCLFVLPAHAKYSGGTGEPNDPYQIATFEDVMLLGESPEDYDKHFILTADIDLDPNLLGRKVFDKAVIGSDWGTPFTGVFDGDGHTICHLTITGKDYLGLFGCLGMEDSEAEVKNLGVVDVNITGSGDCVGGLVGSNGFWTMTRIDARPGGSMSCCYSTGAVNGLGWFVGGLVGSSYGDVRHCYSAGAVSGGDWVGGLMGLNDNGTVTQCYSTSAVNGLGWDVGGLVGVNYGDVTSSFWDIETSGQATMPWSRGTGKTTVEMQDPNTFRAAGWDFVGLADGPHDIWAEPEGGGYPILWWQLSALPPLPRFSGGNGERNEPFLISTPAELNGIGHNPRLMGAHFELANDIDLAGGDFYIIGGEFPFRGSFDGRGHTVSHLTLKGEGYLGMFAHLASGAEVKDLGVVDVNITGSGDCCVGGLVGANGGTLTRCYGTGAVSGNWYVGGLVGGNGGTVTNCCSTGAVSGTGQDSGNIGGLVGSSYRGSVTDCFWDTETSGQATSAGGTGKTTAEMQTAATFLDAGWDFVGETANGTDDIWWILEGKDYPRLWWEGAPQ